MADQALVALDGVDSAPHRRRAHARRPVSTNAPSAPLAVSRCELGEKRVVAALADDVQRREARGAIGARRDRRCATASCSAVAHAGVLSRAPARGAAASAASAEPLFDSSSAAASRTAGVGRAELRAAPAPGERHAADLVVDLDRPCSGRGAGDDQRAGQRMAHRRASSNPRCTAAPSAPTRRRSSQSASSAGSAARVVQRAPSSADARRDRVAPTRATPARRARLASAAGVERAGATRQRRRRTPMTAARQRRCPRSEPAPAARRLQSTSARQPTRGRAELRRRAVAAHPRDRSSRRPSSRCRG